MFNKRGKYESVPVAAPTKAAVKYGNKSKKANLLSAYFTSLLCMMLCATMFLSTSMAWFTSEVNNAGNEIYVGMLDVKLLHEGADLEQNPSHKVLDSTTRWEPNCTVIEKLTVQNDGDLAFNYRLGMSIVYPADFSKEQIALAQEAAEYITVYCYKGTAPTYTNVNSIADITAENSGWTKVGTLTEVLAGKILFSGSMGESDVVTVNGSTIKKVDTSHEYAIAFHMAPDAPSSIMGTQLKDINIKLVAAQFAAEADAFGGLYDQLTVVTNEADLRAALAAGGNVVLLDDISADADKTITVPSGITTNLYMNGHVIAGVSDVADANGDGAISAADNKNLINVEGVLNVYEGTITVKHTAADMDINASTNVINITAGGVVNLEDAKIMNLGGSYMAIGIHMNNWGEVTLNADNSTIFSTYCGVRVFNSGYDMNNVTITNSTLTGTRAVWVHNYTLADFGNDQTKADAAAARLNMNILSAYTTGLAADDASNLNAAANNTIVGSVSYGFTNRQTYYSTTANPVVAADETELTAKLANGGYVVVTEDITLSNASVGVAAGMEATLDLAGHTLTASNSNHAASCAVENRGTLTITNGTVVYKGEGDPSFGYGTNTINNTGKLIIDGATIINTTETGSSVAIDNAAGAELIINDGEIRSMKNAIRLCPFGAAPISCTINGGIVSGSRAIQIQLPSSDASSAPEIKLTVNGGTFNGTSGLSLYSYSAGQSFANVSVTINGGTFNHDVAFGGGSAADQEHVSITGGTFAGYLGRYVEDNGTNDGWEDIAKP